MNKFTTTQYVMLFVCFLIVAPMTSGCSTLDEKILEMKMASIPWAPDKAIMLSTPVHIGPFTYDEMVIALADI